MNSSVSQTKETRSKINWIAVGETLGFVLINFATPIVFYITFRIAGARPAIAFAVGATAIQVFCHWIFRLRFSPFFIVASGFTVLFGGIDLFIQIPRFYRLEPAVQNFVIATAFLMTMFTRVPMITHFAAALPKNFRPDIVASDESYIRKLTWVWIFYLYFKAGVFLFLALHVNLGDLIVLRSLIGGGTIALLFVGEIVYRKWIRRPT